MTSPSMQEWIFTESYGRFDLDLGDSNVELASLELLPGLQKLLVTPPSYGHEAGLLQLRSAIANRYDNTSPANVLVSHGAQEAYSLLVRSVAATGWGEVVVVGSGWSQLIEFPKVLGLLVRLVGFVDTEQGLLEKVASSVSWRTKMIVIASPDNPTGWLASRSLLVGLAEIADAYDALLVVDEEYVLNPAQSVAAVTDSVAVIGGLSKMHGFPGLRIGWCVASSIVIENCIKRKHLTTISNSILTEQLAIAVLENETQFSDRSRRFCAEGFHILSQWVKDHSEITVVGGSESLPFAWLDLGTQIDSLMVARYLLEHRILVIPGEVFNRLHHIRIATARSGESLSHGLKILDRAIRAQSLTNQLEINHERN